jgi:hypothetical protein
LMHLPKAYRGALSDFVIGRGLVLHGMTKSECSPLMGRAFWGLEKNGSAGTCAMYARILADPHPHGPAAGPFEKRRRDVI